jgi:predicted ArsR family transcriptional regulator
MNRTTIRPSPRVLEALASPVRQDLVVILENSPPLAVAEIARRLGRRPDALYHHLRALHRAGLVVPETATATGGRPSGMWRLRVPHIHMSAAGLGRNPVRSAERIVGTLARASVRDFGHALRRAGKGHGPHPRAVRSIVWLSAAERRALETRLTKFVTRLRGREPGSRRTPHVLTVVLAARGEPPESTQKGRPRERAAHQP